MLRAKAATASARRRWETKGSFVVGIALWLAFDASRLGQGSSKSRIRPYGQFTLNTLDAAP